MDRSALAFRRTLDFELYRPRKAIRCTSSSLAPNRESETMPNESVMLGVPPNLRDLLRWWSFLATR